MFTPDVVSDVKDVKYQDLDKQMRSFNMLAKATSNSGKVFEADGVKEITINRDFELIIRDPKRHSEGETKLSGPLRRVLDQTHKVIHDQDQED